MASAMRVFRKFRASDGRIKIATLSGVSALVAVIALLVGVLPVFASHDGDHPLVEPVFNEGNPSCSDVLDAEDEKLEQGVDYLFEHKIDNEDLETTPEDEPIELKFETSEGDTLKGDLWITIDKTSNGEVFDFVFSGDFDAAGVIVKGGDGANFYDYRPSGEIEDEDLHAPVNEKNGKFHSLSHISFCVDEGPNFFCDESVTLKDEDGPIVEVTAEIFANSEHECSDKEATFTNDGATVTLAFEGDGNLTAAGRLDFTKEFGSPPVFEPLEYDPTGSGDDFVVVEWCDTREFKSGDGTEFSDWLPTGTEDGLYPLLPEGETACKVAEDEDLSGTQVTVVYFEFEDPQFR